jgi:hypothetical protein
VARRQRREGGAKVAGTACTGREVRDGAVDAAGAGRQHAHGDAVAAAIVDGVRPPSEVEPAGGSVDEDIVHILMILRRIATRSWLQFFGGRGAGIERGEEARQRCQAACFSLPAGRGAFSCSSRSTPRAPPGPKRSQVLAGTASSQDDSGSGNGRWWRRDLERAGETRGTRRGHLRLCT